MQERAIAVGMRTKAWLPAAPAAHACRAGEAPAGTGSSSFATDEPPLLIDLDRTLIRTDLLLETALAYLCANPKGILRLCGWLLRGRAYLKRKLAELASIDVRLIPANAEVVALASEEKRRGRKVFLVTASDELLANRMLICFPFLDGIIASDGRTNLKGTKKADRIVREFPGGFDYIGDSAADLPVWTRARRVIAVEPSASVGRAVRSLGKPTLILPRTSSFKPLIKAARLHQLAKNTLVFLPAILSGAITRPTEALSCTMAFLAMGLVAVGTYLVNDLCDLAHDRSHWSKRHRPLASGELPLQTALVAAPICIVMGFVVAAGLGVGVLAALAAYLVTTLAYSLRLKRVPVLDGVVLATLFTLRLAIGIAATGVPASPWLLVFSMFLFASLSFAKRHTEVERMAARGIAVVAGRGYVVADAPLLLGLGVATASASILIMVLYLIFDAFSHTFYSNSHWLWCFPIVLFLWVSRIWLLCGRGQLNDDPVAFAVRDPLSLWLGSGMAAAFALAWLGMPL